MATRTNKAVNAGRHSFVDRGHDLYETPPEATLALIAHESLPHFIWEPASGRGAISKVLRRTGHEVIESDLIDYGRRGVRVANFFHYSSTTVKCIVTNPPYKLADRFVEHALRLSPKVIMLLRLAFLEGTGRSRIIDRSPLARVYVFRNRLPMMHQTIGRVRALPVRPRSHGTFGIANTKGRRSCVAYRG